MNKVIRIPRNNGVCLPASILDSDGVTFFDVVSGGNGVCTPITQDTLIKAHFDASTDTTDLATIDSDSTGVYTSISDDGGSGTITVSINGGSFVAFSTLNPLTLVATDTIQFFRTITTGAGFTKLTGTF